jgi:hypothetical protein
MVIAEAQRTLVKSPPELWSELSDPAALARHLGELGEIRIVRAHPEQSVEWEAEDTRGKVEITPSGWGTKVTLSVTIDAPAAELPTGPAPKPASSDHGPAAERPPTTLDPSRATDDPPSGNLEPARATDAAPAVYPDPSRATEESAAEALDASRATEEPAAEVLAPSRATDEAAPHVAEALDPASPATAAAKRVRHLRAVPTLEPETRDPQRTRGLRGVLQRLRGLGRTLRSREHAEEDGAASADPLAVLEDALEEPTPPVRDPEPSAPGAPEPATAPPAESTRAGDAQAVEAAHTGDVETAAGDRGGADGEQNGCENGLAVSRARDEHPDSGAQDEQATRTTELLSAMLDSLGEAHHRPFSRA